MSILTCFTQVSMITSITSSQTCPIHIWALAYVTTVSACVTAVFTKWSFITNWWKRKKMLRIKTYDVNKESLNFDNFFVNYLWEMNSIAANLFEYKLGRKVFRIIKYLNLWQLQSSIIFCFQFPNVKDLYFLIIYFLTRKEKKKTMRII